MIARKEALELLKNRIPEQNLINHSLESEAVMKGLAKKLGKDEDLWAVTGLLHDLDYPETKGDPERHGLEAVKILNQMLPEDALQAIKAHNGERNGVTPETELDFALRCAETVTGLVSANAMVRPQGMKGMKPKSLKKKMKDKAFAANVRRDVILDCEKIGLSIDDFFTSAITEIALIADQVGLNKE
ncbi:MAG: HDIG domain-containing protein [Desulfobacterales bacterium]|nr:HDIG domain-containing protein [Desulfobacterales bacterium]